MGLDMYLYRKTYVPTWDGDGEDQETRQRTSSRGQLKITGLKQPIDSKKVCYIVEEVGYWRKANAIHDWFVRNVQDGNDDCKSYYVDSSQLEDLLDTVNKVLESTKLVKGKVNAGTTFKNGKAEQIIEEGKTMKDPTVARDLLPTAEGFFFGGTDYDEWYWNDLVETKKIIEEALAGATGVDFEYSSSW